MYLTYVETMHALQNHQFELRTINRRIDKLCAGPGDVKAIAYDSTSLSSSCTINDSELYAELKKLINKRDSLMLQINYDKQILDDLDKHIGKLLKGENSIEYEVFRQHFIRKVPLYYVAKNLGYAYGYTRNVASRVKKKLRKCERIAKIE